LNSLNRRHPAAEQSRQSVTLHADALAVGCAAILTKPYTAAQLEEVLAATVTCAVAPRFGLT